MVSPFAQLTVDDKVLLHLSQFIFTPDDPEAPLEATQEGIADAAGINATHVPRSVQNLRKKGHIVEYKLPVGGSDRRRKAYRPTDDGYRKAQEIKGRLLEAELLLREEDGTVRTTTLHDLYGTTVTVNQVLKAVRATQPMPLLDRGQTDAVPAGAGPMAASLYNKVPQVSEFVGRKDELKELQKALKEDSVRLVAVTGIAGIGKTTLVAKALEKFRKTPVFWYRLHEWETLRNIGFVMADFLAQLDRPDLRAYMEGRREHDVAEAYEIVQRDLEGVEAIVVLDDFDKAPRSFLGFIKTFLPQLDRFTGIKFLVVTRASIPFFSESDRVEGRVTEITLAGLDAADARRMLPGRPDAETVRELTEVTEGHPLLLKLFSSAEEDGDDEEESAGPRESLVHKEGIHRFLTEEILGTLSQAERRALEAASVHRYPIPPEVLFIEEDIDFDVIDALRRRLLLRSVGGRYVEPMDFVREFVYQRLKPENRRRLHEQAAQAIEGAGLEGTAWMVPSHLLAAGSVEEAARAALKTAPRYLERGKVEELATMLRALQEADGLPPKEAQALAEVRAELYARSGDTARAAEWRKKAQAAAR